MINKRFFKILGIFVMMILVGLIGVFVVSYINEGDSTQDLILE